MLPDDLLRKKIFFEFEQIEKELSVIETVFKSKNSKLDEIELRAVASSLHSIYNGIEKIIIHIFKAHKIEIPSNEKSHSELLKRAFGNKIISFDLEKRLREYMGFRHFYRHAYGFMLDNELMAPLLENVTGLVLNFKNEIANGL